MNVGTVQAVVTAPKPRKRQQEVVLPAPAPELVTAAPEPVLVTARA